MELGFMTLTSRELLIKLKEEHRLVAIKAEFEAEGISLDELALYADLAQSTSIELTLKIGGPGAQRDMFEAWQVGASTILVPMVESLSALLHSNEMYKRCESTFDSILLKNPRFLINIETIKAVQQSSLIAATAKLADVFLDGIVIGRKDLAASMEISSVEDAGVTQMALKAINCYSDLNFFITVGGGVSPSSYCQLDKLYKAGVSAYETRKCTFLAINLENNQSYLNSINYALRFERAWLVEKYSIFNAASAKDLARVVEIDRRLEA